MKPYYSQDGVDIYHGDALAVLQGLEAGLVQSVITDPPYSSGGQFRGDRMQNTSDKYTLSGTIIERSNFTGDNRDQRSYAFWCALWLSECHRIATDGAPVCMFTDWRQLPITTDLLQAGGWVWRGIAAWDKTSACRPSLGRFSAQCEYIVWGSKGPMPTERGVGTLPGVFQVMVRQDDKFHIAGKPTPLMTQVVGICEPGGVVLDPFMGSGSTGVAAINTGRHFVGIELLESNCEVAAKRFQQRTIFAPPTAPPVQLTIESQAP